MNLLNKEYNAYTIKVNNLFKLTEHKKYFKEYEKINRDINYLNFKKYQQPDISSFILKCRPNTYAQPFQLFNPISNLIFNPKINKENTTPEPDFSLLSLMVFGAGLFGLVKWIRR